MKRRPHEPSVECRSIGRCDPRLRGSADGSARGPDRWWRDGNDGPAEFARCVARCARDQGERGMSDADESLELRLARQARDEAAADRKDAEKDLAEAQYLRA